MTAWITPIDVNDGQTFDGDAVQSYVDSIEQIQTSIGADDTALDVVPKLIEEYTSPGSETSISFSSIPATFRHLRVLARTRHDNGSGTDSYRSLALRFNGNTSMIYDFNASYIQGNTATVTTTVGDNANQAVCGYVGAQPGNLVVDIPDYVTAGARTFHAIGGARIGAVTSTDTRNVLAVDGIWSNAAVINQVTLLIAAPGGDSFAAGSVFSLYGLP